MIERIIDARILEDVLTEDEMSVLDAKFFGFEYELDEGGQPEISSGTIARQVANIVSRSLFNRYLDRLDFVSDSKPEAIRLEKSLRDVYMTVVSYEEKWRREDLPELLAMQRDASRDAAKEHEAESRRAAGF